MDGAGASHTNSPCSSQIGLAFSSYDFIFIPNAELCNSPAYTGMMGLPAAKQPLISVPPAMELKCKSDFISRYTYSNPSAESGEPVCEISRNDDKSKLVRGEIFSFFKKCR